MSKATTIEKFDDIIEWSVDNHDPMGYFAVIYRASTAAVHDNIRTFDKPTRMHLFMDLFAERYFAAVNAHLASQFMGRQERPGWVGAFDPQLCALASVILPINSHIVGDLGYALAELAGTPSVLASFRRDFVHFNAVAQPCFDKGWQALDAIVPNARWLRRLGTAAFWPPFMAYFRERSWAFGMNMLTHPEDVAELCGTQLDYTRRIDRRWRLVLPAFSQGESRDVVSNIEIMKKGLSCS